MPSLMHLHRFLIAGRIDSLQDCANDHAAGDAALRKVASLLKRRLRSQDLIFRYGGDEFVCVLPNAGIEAAQTLMVQVWQQLQEQRARL